MSRKKSPSKKSAVPKDQHEDVADDMLLGDFLEPHEVEAEAQVNAAQSDAASVEDSASTISDADRLAASDPSPIEANDLQDAESSDPSASHDSPAVVESESEDEDDIDVVGAALADEIDDLINLANAAQGKGKVKMEDMFVSPEQLAAESIGENIEQSNDLVNTSVDEELNDKVADKADDTVSHTVENTETTSAQFAPETKSETTDQIEPKAAIEQDDSDGMQGDFATLDDVINEVEPSNQIDATAKSSLDDEIESDTSTDLDMDSDMEMAAQVSTEPAQTPPNKTTEVESTQEVSPQDETSHDELEDDLAASFETVDEVVARADDDDVPESTSTPTLESAPPVAEAPAGVVVADEQSEFPEAPLADANAIDADPVATDPVEAATESEDDFAEMAASFESFEEVTSPDEAAPVDAMDAPVEIAEPTDPVAREGDGTPINQIDELLAEQADTAVAGDFETPGEILAAEQIGSSNVNDTPQDAAEQFDDELGDFDSPDDVLHEGDDAAKSMDRGTIMEAPLLQPNQPDAVESEEAVPSADASDDDIPAVDAFDDVEEIDLHEKAEPVASDGKSGGIITILVNNLYRFCEMTNRPLQGTSDSTKKLVGIIGLITVANASVIMLGKMVFSMLG